MLEHRIKEEGLKNEEEKRNKEGKGINNNVDSRYVWLAELIKIRRTIYRAQCHIMHLVYIRKKIEISQNNLFFFPKVTPASLTITFNMAIKSTSVSCLFDITEEH